MTPLNPPQDLLGALARGERSASELLEQCLGRIADTDGRVNAFTRISHVRARREAADIDRRRRHGEALPPLAGLPYAVKNLFDIEGEVTLAGSKINREHAPARADAVLVAAPARGRRGAGGLAQHGRVRLRLHHREHALRADAQPARPRRASPADRPAARARPWRRARCR